MQRPRRKAHGNLCLVRTQRDASVFFVPLVARTGRPPLGPRMGRAPLAPDARDRRLYKRSLVDNVRPRRKAAQTDINNQVRRAIRRELRV